MLPVSQLRNKSSGGVLAQAALAYVAILALLFARITPPEFPRTPTFRSTVNCAAQHDQRQCFDHDCPQWIGPSRSPLPAPRPQVGIRLAHTSEPFVQIALRGFHYNRLPPVG
jgi:hypothetical protein